MFFFFLAHPVYNKKCNAINIILYANAACQLIHVEILLIKP